MAERAERYQQILLCLRRSLGEGGLRLLYQPQHDLHSGELRAMEALLRCALTEHKGFNTRELIQAAEEGGLIAQLDNWALHRACVELRDWNEQGCTSLRMVVNISGPSLAQASFANEVAECLRLHQLPAHRLELQLREETLHRPSAEQTRTLDELRRLGVLISIDGFGTAYFSLHQLSTARSVSRISIDATLTRGIGEVSWKQRAIDAIIALANSLGIEVVVQGLESEAQVDYLRRHPSLLAQGFLLEPPLEAEQCWKLIQRHAGMATLRE